MIVEANLVDTLSAVDSRVVGFSIEIGFSGVFGGNIVDDLVVKLITDVEYTVELLVDLLVKVAEGEGVVGIVKGFSGVLGKMVE